MKKEDISVIINVKLEDFFVTFRQSPDNYDYTEMLTTDICSSHLTADRRPRTFMTFENHELDSIIKALTAYRDTVNILK